MRKLRTVGRIVVLAAGCLALVALLFHFVYRPWQLNWGATDEEIKRAMAGDEIVSDPTFNATRAVTVNAPAARIWPWIVQMGYRRAGFYSWDILDNDGIPSSERVIPEYQILNVGDLVPLSAKVNMLVAVAEPNRRLLLMTQSNRPWTWSWGLYPIDAHRTRLVSRLRVRLRTLSSQLWIDAFEIVMMRKCLLGIKRRAERSDDGAPKTLPEGAHSRVGGSSRRGYILARRRPAHLDVEHLSQVRWNSTAPFSARTSPGTRHSTRGARGPSSSQVARRIA